MKDMFLYIIRYILLLWVMVAVVGVQKADAQGIGFTPRAAYLRNDSLHLQLDMELDGVTVNSYTAVWFTPILASTTGRDVLPPVIVSGSKRYRFDRRQWALRTEDEKLSFPAPYLILTGKKAAASRSVHYHISVPYATWMAGAALLMKQEVKDCCDLQLLGIDTLCADLSRLADLPSAPQGQVVKSPRPVTVPVAVAAAERTVQVTSGYSMPEVSVTTYASMLSFLEPNINASGKRRSQSVALYLDYPLGRDDVLPDYKNNRAQLDKLSGILSPLMKNGYSTIEGIEVCGYASPDGDYRNNERLAADRSSQFAAYVRGAYGISGYAVKSFSVAEDWDGLCKLLTDERPYYMNEALEIIRRYGIFGGRERKLMELWNGVPYKDMLHCFFPRLRRIEVTAHYGIRAVGGDEASRLIYSHPELLSLPEIYAVARYYRSSTEQYREVYEIAAYRFPDDVVANVNAASAVMLTGDLESARGYLAKVADDPRSWNNRGMLSLMEGDVDNAIIWFRRAVGIEPRKARRNLQIAQSMQAERGTQVKEQQSDGGQLPVR